MDFPFGETVLFLPHLGDATDDAHGNPVDSWAAESAGVAIPGCAFNPGTSVESAEGNRNSVTTTPELYCPRNAPITAKGRVLVRGELYEVDGNPGRYVNPFTGWAPPLVVKLRQVSG